jgi:hypothetical protein
LLSKDYYPYINYFVKENIVIILYSKTWTSEDINNIMQHIQRRNFRKRKFLTFKYSNFKSLDDLVSFYSKNNMICQNNTNPINGISISYDIDKIERELSIVSHSLKEENYHILNHDSSCNDLSSFYKDIPLWQNKNLLFKISKIFIN